MLQINLHRGDYIKKNLKIFNSNKKMLDIDFDEIYITFKKSTNLKDFLFQKKLSTGEIVKNDDGYYEFEILPEDTNNLEFGEYDFDIEVYRKEPSIKQTFLGILDLTEEVTYAVNE